VKGGRSCTVRALRTGRFPLAVQAANGLTLEGPSGYRAPTAGVASNHRSVAAVYLQVPGARDSSEALTPRSKLGVASASLSPFGPSASQPGASSIRFLQQSYPNNAATM
jgi:hypothetical protein